MAALCDSEKARRASGTHTCSAAHYKVTTLSKDFMNAVKVPIFKKEIFVMKIFLIIDVFLCSHVFKYMYL